MPSKSTKGYNPSHDIEFKAGRRINWKNDLAIGKKRRTNLCEVSRKL